MQIFPNIFRETIPSPHGPREVQLGKVILVMKGQKTQICRVIIISSTELRYYGNQKTIKICSNKTNLEPKQENYVICISVHLQWKY